MNKSEININKYIVNANANIIALMMSHHTLVDVLVIPPQVLLKTIL